MDRGAPPARVSGGTGGRSVRALGHASRHQRLPRARPSSVRIDVFIAKTEFERTVIATARTAAVLGTTVRLARPEGSIIYKLLASRPKDLDDVEAIFAARRAAGDVLDWSFLDYWAAEWGIADRLAPYRAGFGPGTF